MDHQVFILCFDVLRSADIKTVTERLSDAKGKIRTHIRK